MGKDRPILGRKLETLAAIRFPKAKTDEEREFRLALEECLISELLAFADGMARESRQSRRNRLAKGAARYLDLLFARNNQRSEQRGMNRIIRSMDTGRAIAEAEQLKGIGVKLN